MSAVVQIRLPISNAFLIRGDRPILVDSGTTKDGTRILAALEKADVKGHDLALILHTHGHSDHCGGTRQLKTATSAPTAIHSADAAAMDNGHNPMTNPTCLTARLVHALIDGRFPSVRPDILLPDQMDLQAFGVRGMVIATPGHTAGSVSVLLRDGAAIVGDMLMGGWLGGLLRSGHPGYPYFADDLGQIRAGVAKMLDLGATRFFVGHGGPIESQRVKTWLARASSRSAG